MSIPRIFAKASESEVKCAFSGGKAKHRLLVVSDEGLRVLDVGDEVGELVGDVYIQRVYDDAYRWLVDFEAGVVLKSAVVLPLSGPPIFLHEGERVYLIEALGRIVVPLVRVGEVVSPGRRLAAIFTGKRELRYLRSDVSGRIAYVGQIDVKPQRYIFILIPRLE
ncbi:MAG: hypothetical protein DRJ18_00565 [Candidatus Methanomethylicota archaeon]|nr:DUF2118 domain-containing protein [Candidatus Culexmicrobium cathedralense]RLE49074.1 MAG: hypothetical protein DRJ18_00565 [Candidatus Verstraetearchaeota archaeon]